MRVPAAVLLLFSSPQIISGQGFGSGNYYQAPAGSRFAVRASNAGAGILPGGRILAPTGNQIFTGPGPFGLALSPSGRTIATVNLGFERQSISVIEKSKGPWTVRHLPVAKLNDPAEKEDWRTLSTGIAFSGEKSAWISEGETGRVRLVDLSSGGRKRVVDLDGGSFHDSFAGDIAFDPARNLLYVVDQANFRLVVVDTKKGTVASSVIVGRLPYALALSPDGKHAYVTCVGMLRYAPIPGADIHRAKETGLPFPAFGFPSAEATEGVTRKTASGEVAVPGLGDPNVQESESLAIVNVAEAGKPRLETYVRTGEAFGADVHGGSAPSGVLATRTRIYVSNAHNDSITVIDAANSARVGEISIRIPGLESLRGVMPLGMAFDAARQWLFVAEAGINAIGVIDAAAGKVLGHFNTGWFPVKVALDEDTLYVASARGLGSGPNTFDITLPEEGSGLANVSKRGVVSVAPEPAAAELEKSTRLVLAANGFLPVARPAIPLPPVGHVVLIVKENRTYDEVLGDITKTAAGGTAGGPRLARFGKDGFADGQHGRLSLQHLNVTPNHHALAEQWAFGDNFYADSDVSVDGHHWLAGAYPDAWTESSLLTAYTSKKSFRLTPQAPGRLLFAESNSSVHPEELPSAGTLWEHLERHGISFRNFGEGFELAGNQETPNLEPTGARFLTNVPMPDALFRNTSRSYPGFNMNIPDQYRADQFIREFDELYGEGKAEMPQFLYLHLPNDHMAPPRPEDGYPFAASFVSDNDLALGRIVEHLSHTSYWKDMAIFVTEDDAQGGRDHIDSHRTVLLAIGPWFRKNWDSHTNSSFPGLQKTILELLHVPPMNLFDASASSLRDLFAASPDLSPYRAVSEDPRLFSPERAKAPAIPMLSPRMDAPSQREREKP